MKQPTIEEQDRQFLRFIFKMLVCVCVGYAVLWFAILSKWEPGNQEAISQEYKASRHEAKTVEVVAK
jgi:hypothetical protein